MNISHVPHDEKVTYLSFASNGANEMKYDHLTLARLKEMLIYDPEDGSFTWRQRPFVNSRKHIGDSAGTKKGKGYLYIGLDSRTYLASQLAWFYMHGVWAKGEVGVKNKNPSDLRIENLMELRTTPGSHDFTTKAGFARYGRDYRRANPGAHRASSFRRFYGIDLGDYQRMFVEQGGLCAICRLPETAKSRWNPGGEAKWLSVDHDHTTNAVRGLLCAACNHTLGHSRDNADILRAAAEYLDQHRTQAEPLREAA
jgi:hypothetical protein